MSVRYLLDTNICIYIRRQRPQKILTKFQQLASGEAGLSIVTYGELHYGAEAGRVYGTIRAALERRGERIGANDLWIAAHAMTDSLTLVTNNEREFRRVSGLNVENWAG